MVFEGTGVAAAKLYKGALKPGMAATTIGWGKIDDVFGGSESLNLKMAGVYIGEDNVCKAYDSSYMSGKFTSNNGATTCIDDSKSTGNGPCDGDFGGPFVITVGEEDQVAGIYSYGGGPEGNAECAANGGFNFYENLYKQLSFILSETGISL
ncbi:hypothetical protein FBU59_002009 [Linderina macrospora]|uniref:Uncharacterized protein n=1 Tax=Linderina macrospora TaxID=4868 RepID=A0ACC1JCF6_9FUNG|nr:hypothetical protein FBU59_002009 [Linderina macrospora]